MRFLALYALAVEPGLALKLQKEGSWRQFLVLTFLTPICCMLHAMVHPMTFR